MSVVPPKVATFSTSANSVTLTHLTQNQSSSANLSFSTSNVEQVELRVIPSEFTITVDGLEKSSGDFVPTDATLVITKSDNFEAGIKSGTLSIRATASANSKFSGNATTFNKSICLSGDVVVETTIMTINPTAVNDTFDESETADTVHSIRLTTAFLSKVVVSGGSASKYQISSTPSGPWSNSITIDNPTTDDVYVKFTNTSSAGTFVSSIKFDGTKTANGEADPSDKTLTCTAVVNAIPPATLELDTSSISDGDVEFNSSPTVHTVALTKANVKSVTISGGSASGYRVAKSKDGSYKDSISFASQVFADGSGVDFYVALVDTSFSRNVSTT